MPASSEKQPVAAETLPAEGMAVDAPMPADQTLASEGKAVDAPMPADMDQTLEAGDLFADVVPDKTDVADEPITAEGEAVDAAMHPAAAEVAIAGIEAVLEQYEAVDASRHYEQSTAAKVAVAVVEAALEQYDADSCGIDALPMSSPGSDEKGETTDEEAEDADDDDASSKAPGTC